MKKRLALVLTAITLSITLFVGCGSAADVSESNETVEEDVTPIIETTSEEEATPEETAIPEPSEEPHEHAYVETITTEATCETEGEATYTCECGDTYTETIKALGHIYENYTSNNDATYLADGTETAKCKGCDLTDTRTAEGSKLEYTYNEMNATMYAQQTVNVRSMPSTDGEKLGSLSTNDEIKVTGQCNETSWYRIEFDGNVAYVSDSYLGTDKVEISATNDNNNSSVSSDFPYELLTRYVTPDGKISYYYCTEDCSWKTHGWHQVHYTCNNYNNVTFGHETASGLSYETTMSNFTVCDDMDGYIQAAAANGLVARRSVETPWKTADGKKIRAFCP